MKLTLSVKQLEDASACFEAIIAFRQVYGEAAEVEWTKEAQVEILRGPLGKYLGWAFRAGLLPMWSLDGANLDGANLDGANLTGAYLTGASLARANLARANFTGASLARANLTGASLARANLTGAKVCLCSDGACTRLREFLAAAGWAPGADDLLARLPKPAEEVAP